MTILIVVLCVLATFAGTPRWLRVAQREHYLPWTVSWTDQLWLSRSPKSAGLWFLAVIAFVLAILVSPWFFVGAAVIGQLTPVGLPYRGRTAKLAWTPRVRRLSVVVGSLVLVFGILGAPFAAVASLALPSLVDIALYSIAPLEKAMSKRFLTRAADTVVKVKPQIIAITGSYGKTTTKNYLAHLLSADHSVLATPASFNNAMGLSRAVNEHLVPGIEVFIAEMGTYGPGEIRALCKVFPPNISVITSIGEVHLQRMGDRKGVLAAKTEITERAEVVVLNADDDLLAELATTLAKQGKRVLRTSVKDTSVEVAFVAEMLWVNGSQVGSVRLPDSVHPSNAAVAVAAAIALGDKPNRLLSRLATLPTVAHRLEPIEQPGGSWILDDTYNSNPVGAAEAVRRSVALAARSGGRVHVVTPGMVELGRVQAARNTDLGAAVKDAGAATLVVVGATNAKALKAGGSGGSTDVVSVATRPEAVALVEKRSSPGDVVLYENDLPDHYP